MKLRLRLRLDLGKNSVDDIEWADIVITAVVVVVMPIESILAVFEGLQTAGSGDEFRFRYQITDVGKIGEIYRTCET